jgi:hypothetical protein
LFKKFSQQRAGYHLVSEIDKCLKTRAEKNDAKRKKMTSSMENHAVIEKENDVGGAAAHDGPVSEAEPRHGPKSIAGSLPSKHTLINNTRIFPLSVVFLVVFGSLLAAAPPD